MIGVFNASALPIQGNSKGGRQILVIQFVGQVTISFTTMQDFNQTKWLMGLSISNPDQVIMHSNRPDQGAFQRID